MKRPNADGIIKKDHSRYRDVARSKVRKDLKKYLRDRHLVSRQGKKTIRVKIPTINIPKFRFGSNKGGGKGYGVGHGVSGKPGDVLTPGKPPGGAGQGKPGNEHTEHGRQEFELSRAEIAEVLGEELSLPNMQPKDSGQIEVIGHRYSGKATVGPDALLLFRATYENALQRMVSEGTYDEEDPLVTPIEDDLRYRTMKPITKPLQKAVIFFIRDVSASMGLGNRAELSFASSYWLELWIEHCYEGEVEKVYILHDHEAWEAGEEEFRTSSTSGGTSISNALALTKKMIGEKYDVNRWNIFIFQYGDGEGWEEDFRNCVHVLGSLISDICLYGYTQVCGTREGDYNNFLTALLARNAIKTSTLTKKLRTVTLPSFDEMPDALKGILG